MEFRLGTMNDLQNICSLVAAAIETMEEQGIHQWDKVYPTREDFANDIANVTLYTVTEESRLIAIYTISTEYDPEYLNAEWECNGEGLHHTSPVCFTGSSEQRNRKNRIKSYRKSTSEYRV